MGKRIIFIVLLLEICLILKTVQKNLYFKKNRRLKEEELSDDIIILHTNDVHCSIKDSIGYDGLMLYKKELKKRYKHVLTVDAGDHIQGGAIGLLSKGLDIIDIMNTIEYDVVTIGNHEFDYGIAQLNICEEKLNCGYISANFCYRKNKTTIFPPYKIVDLGDKKIGFIGVTTPQTLSKTYLHNIVDEDGKMLYDFLAENEGQELYNTIQGYIDEVKLKGANYAILLCHLGNEGDAAEKYTTNALISHISGIDAVIDGHTHKIYNTATKDKEGKDILLTQTGTKLTHLGVIKISKDGIISEMLSEIPKPEYIEYRPDFRDNILRYVDPDMYKILSDIIDSHSDELKEKIGYTDFDLTINTDQSGDSSKQKSRSEENTLCDLVADAIRYIGNGDISMINAGSIRADLMKGDITFQNILDILPFSEDIIIKEVLGSDILDSLEFGMKNLPGKSSIFPQVSGISFRVDLSIKSPIIVDDDEMFVKVEGTRRVSNVMIGDKPLDVNKKYNISFDNYIANGGDGFSMFNKYEELSSTLKTDNQAFMIYIKDVLNGIIPDKYRTTQGRIIIINDSKEENLGYFIKNTLKPMPILLLFLVLL